MVESVRIRVFVDQEDDAKADGIATLTAGADDELNLDYGTAENGVLIVINIEDLLKALSNKIILKSVE